MSQFCQNDFPVNVQELIMKQKLKINFKKGFYLKDFFTKLDQPFTNHMPKVILLILLANWSFFAYFMNVQLFP